MQINTRITNSTYYETCSQRTYAENNLSVSFKMKYSEIASVNRSYEGRGKSAVDAYNELGSGKTKGIETSGNEPSDYALKSLGMGFLMVGNHGYGMSASQVISNENDDVIVKVRLTKGQDDYEDYEINLSKFDPQNATAIEMFAYCQYADANGTGTGSTFGSWHDLKTVISPMNGMEFSSIDEAVNVKRNWSRELASSKTILTKQSTGESISAENLLKMLNETSGLVGNNGDKDYVKMLADMIEDILERLQSGNPEHKMWIGGRDFSFKDWDDFLAKFDKLIDEMRNNEASGRAATRANVNKDVIAETFIKNNTQVKAAESDKPVASASDVANMLTSETTMCTYPSDKSEDGTKYITVYSKNGIQCWKSGSSGYESDWSIDFENEEQYEKVKGLLEKFPDDYNFNFAAHQSFWEDYLSGAIDENEFVDFMKDSRNGIPNYSIGDEYNMRIDESKVKWAKYFNNPESRVYSGQKEFEEMVAKQLMGRNGELTGLHKPEMYKSDRKVAPYQHLADESGFINYNGVTFHCDAEKNQITLGDCSDPNKCMMVTLKDGGTLMVNYDNVEDLTKAITMFSPEDQVRIMRAITVHKMSKQAQKEIDDDKNSIGDNPIGKYRDNALGYNVEVYESEKGNSLYTIKTKYDDGREEVREVDADSIDASDCNIIDLFAKLKHLEKNGKCEKPVLDFVISHLYMNYRKPGADENTKIDFKKWFEQQLELEKKQKTGFYPHQLEKLLLYL